MKKVSKQEMIEILKDLLTYGCQDSCLDDCKEHKYGKFFSVEFVKKTDGSIRPMTCRLGVKKGQTGRGLLFDALAKGLLPVWDVQKEGYRFINLDSLRKATIQQEEYTCIE